MPSTNFDVGAQVTAVPCKQCTQSSDSRCSSDFLASTFAIGSTHVKAAYCNDAFLVIWSDGLPQHSSTYLSDIPNPPGADGCLMRTNVKQSLAFKIPLTTTPLATGAKNILATYPNNELPLSGAIGVAVNGVPMYPTLDASNLDIWTACEADLCNAHAGKGADYHYHGDPFGTGCLYTEKDVKNNHPIVIGFSLDGYTIYGRHTSADQDGQAIALDRCGGHTHGTYGYHYHTELVEGTKHTQYFMGPSYCWTGDISKIANFWDKEQHQAEFDNSFTNPKFTPSGRQDYELLKPCCSSTTGYLTTGATLNGSTLTASTTTTTGSTTGSGFIKIISTILAGLLFFLL